MAGPFEFVLVSSVHCAHSARAMSWMRGYRTLRVAGSVTFQRRRCGHRTQRVVGPFGVLPPSYPRRHGERWDACEPSGPTFVSVNASCAREHCNLRAHLIGGAPGPFDAHIHPLSGAWAAAPGRHQVGVTAQGRVTTASRRAQLPGPQPPLPHNSIPAATLPALPARRDRASTPPIRTRVL